MVVVGGGLAGLAASIEASRGGAKVTLMEKGNRIGGNSAKATSGAVGTTAVLVFGTVPPVDCRLDFTSLRDEAKRCTGASQSNEHDWLFFSDKRSSGLRAAGAFYVRVT